LPLATLFMYLIYHMARRRNLYHTRRKLRRDT